MAINTLYMTGILRKDPFHTFLKYAIWLCTYIYDKKADSEVEP